MLDTLLLILIALGGMLGGLFLTCLVWRMLKKIFGRKKSDKTEETPKKDKEYCTVTFVLNNGSGDSVPVKVESGATVAKSSPIATKKGYIFKHWFLSGTDETESFTLKTPITENTTLLAYYVIDNYAAAEKPVAAKAEAPEEKKYYTVTFVLNNGSGDNVPVKVESGATVARSAPTATKPGHGFKHWYLTGASQADSFNLNTQITENVTLLACYTPDNATLEKPAVQSAVVQQTEIVRSKGKPVLYNVEAPADGTEYTISDLTDASVNHGESYGFVLTLKENYTKAPSIAISGGNGSVDKPKRQAYGVYTYEVTNVIGNIASVDYKVGAITPTVAEEPVTVIEQVKEKPKTVVHVETAAAKAEPVVHVVEEQKPAPLPPGLFTLSRNDVLDHAAEMMKNAERFPLKIGAKLRAQDNMPDYLSVSDWCFAMVFDRHDIVFNFVLRMDGEAAKKLGQCHPIESVSSLSDDNWYTMTIDRSFESKREIYDILDECCDFTMKQYCHSRKKADTPQVIEAQGQSEQAKLEEEAAKKYEELAYAAEVAEAKYKVELEKFKTENYIKFLITRKEIAEHTRGLNNPDIEVIERLKSLQMPWTLRYREKAYAMLYAADEGVLMVLQLDDNYVMDTLVLSHPEICRTKFPKGANWYQLPIDGAFRSKDEVYHVLNSARIFVGTKVDAQLAEEKLKAAKRTIAEIKSSAPKPAEKKPAAVSKAPAPAAKKEPVEKKGKVYHVSQHENGWQVKAEGAEKVLKTFSTQKEAIEYANQIGGDDSDNRTVVHRVDGRIRKA